MLSHQCLRIWSDVTSSAVFCNSLHVWIATISRQNAYNAVIATTALLKCLPVRIYDDDSAIQS
jgi:hypothetical protein